MKKIKLEKEYVWDYKKPVNDLTWKLQRIALFFPSIGTDRETINLLYQKRDELKIEEGKYVLIGIYKELWDAKDKRKNKRK